MAPEKGATLDNHLNRCKGNTSIRLTQTFSQKNSFIQPFLRHQRGTAYLKSTLPVLSNSFFEISKLSVKNIDEMAHFSLRTPEIK